VLIGSAIAIITSDGPATGDPIVEPSSPTNSDVARAKIAEPDAADRLVERPVSLVPAAVEVSNPSPRDVYREPPLP
jgi:hypothetical protein